VTDTAGGGAFWAMAMLQEATDIKATTPMRLPEETVRSSIKVAPECGLIEPQCGEFT
jgi:hypothetical protein